MGLYLRGFSNKKIHIMGKNNLKQNKQENELDVFKRFRNNDPNCNLKNLQDKFIERLKSDSCIDEKIVIKREYEKMQKLTITYLDPGEDIDQHFFLEGVVGAESNSLQFLEGNGPSMGESGILMFAKGWASIEYLVWLRKNYSNELGFSNSNKKNDFSDIKWKGKVNDMAQLIHVLYSSKKIFRGEDPILKKDLEIMFSEIFNHDFKNTSDTLRKSIETTQGDGGKTFIDELLGYIKDFKDNKK